MKRLLFLLLIPTQLFSQNLNIEVIGRFDTPGTDGFDMWVYHDSLNEREYALIGVDGIYVVDVTDPTNPVEATYLPGVAFFDVKVWQNYAYTVNGSSGGFGHIIDLTDPYNAVVVDSFPSAHNIWINENGHLFAEINGLKIYDLNPDPLNPLELFDSQTIQGHDAFTKGNRLYDFHGYDGTNIYDITNINNPVLVGNIEDPKIAYHHSGWVTEDDQYLFICDELSQGNFPDITIWNIADPMEPQRVSQLGDSLATVHNLYIIGNYAYVSYYAAGFRIYDITDPTRPQLAAEYDSHPSMEQGFSGGFGVYPFSGSGYIYFHDRDSGLFVFQITDSTPPTPIDTSEFVEGLRIYPNPAYGQVTIEHGHNFTGDIELQITDAAGRQVFKTNEESHFGTYQTTVNTSQFSTGVYQVFYTMHSNKAMVREHKKLVVIK